MAKELEKFKAEHKKLAAGTKKFTTAEGDKLKKRIGISLGNAWEGEDYFRESLAKARADGVTSGKMADFQKNKHFKDGMTTWNKSVDIHQGEVDAMKGFCTEAKAHLVKMNKLASEIEKDLKKRSKTSDSKKDIEALQGALAKEIAGVKKASEYEGKLNAMQKLYAANFQKNVAKIMKETPDSHDKKKDATELPQLLVDRNLKKYTNQGGALVKASNAHCVAAIDKAGQDLKAAAPDLKAAAAKYKDLKKINDQYQTAKKKFPGAIEDSKDKKKLLATLKKFNDLTAAAERKVRGTTVTIKKAAA
jgi:superfamily II DNA helicase RecQ